MTQTQDEQNVQAPVDQVQDAVSSAQTPEATVAEPTAPASAPDLSAVDFSTHASSDANTQAPSNDAQ
jgi:hypothetical protein